MSSLCRQVGKGELRGEGGGAETRLVCGGRCSSCIPMKYPRDIVIESLISFLFESVEIVVVPADNIYFVFLGPDVAFGFWLWLRSRGGFTRTVRGCGY